MEPDTQRPDPAQPTAEPGLPILRSEDLFTANREVVILHGDSRYRLRLTSNDKLILVK